MSVHIYVKQAMPALPPMALLYHCSTFYIIFWAEGLGGGGASQEGVNLQGEQKNWYLKSYVSVFSIPFLLMDPFGWERVDTTSFKNK